MAVYIAWFRTRWSIKPPYANSCTDNKELLIWYFPVIKTGNLAFYDILPSLQQVCLLLGCLPIITTGNIIVCDIFILLYRCGAIFIYGFCFLVIVASNKSMKVQLMRRSAVIAFALRRTLGEMFSLGNPLICSRRFASTHFGFQEVDETEKGNKGNSFIGFSFYLH